MEMRPCLYDVEVEVRELREDLAAMSSADYDLVEITCHLVDFWRDGERAIATYKYHGCMVGRSVTEDGEILYEATMRYYAKLSGILRDLEGYEITRAELSDDECSLLVHVR